MVYQLDDLYLSDNEELSDELLVRQLREFGENIRLPIKRGKREILRKKLNHYTARENSMLKRDRRIQDKRFEKKKKRIKAQQPVHELASRHRNNVRYETKPLEQEHPVERRSRSYFDEVEEELSDQESDLDSEGSESMLEVAEVSQRSPPKRTSRCFFLLLAIGLLLVIYLAKSSPITSHPTEVYLREKLNLFLEQLIQLFGLRKLIYT